MADGYHSFQEFAPPPTHQAFTGHHLPFIGFTFSKERYDPSFGVLDDIGSSYDFNLLLVRS